MFGFKKTPSLSPVERASSAYRAPDERDAPLLGKFQQRWFDGDRFLYLECTTSLAGSSEHVECDLDAAAAFMSARNSDYKPQGFTGRHGIPRIQLAAFAHNTIRRCVPWVDVLTVPAIVAASDAAQLAGAWGLAAYPKNGFPPSIAIATAWAGYETYATVHHEIWHVAERHLSADMVESIDREMRTTPVHMLDRYYDSDIERRARMYEHYAHAKDLGFKLNGVYNETVVSMNTVFDWVYNGRFAQFTVEKRRDPVVLEWMRRT